MFHIDDNLTNRFRIPVKWFNAVAQFVNNLAPGFGLRIARPDNPSASNPVTVEIDPEAIDTLGYVRVPTPSEDATTTALKEAELATHAPEAVLQAYMDANGDAYDETNHDKAERVGSSILAARADHKHRDPVIHQTRQTLDDMFFIDDDLLCFSPPKFDCGGRFLGLDDDSAFAIDIPIGNIDFGSLDGLLSVDGSGNLTALSIGTTSGTVAAGDHTHTTGDITDLDLSDYAEASHTHTVSDITNLNLSGFLDSSDIGTTVQAYSANLASLAAALASGGKVPLSMLTGNISGHSGDCLVTIDTNGTLGHSGNDAYNALDALVDEYDSTNDKFNFLKWGSSVQVKSNLLLRTDNSGNVAGLALPTTAVLYDRVLTIASGSGSLSWGRASYGAEDPGNDVTDLASASGTTANASSWQAGGANGVAVREHRTVWDGTYLYGFYRDKVYDRHGRLYSVSAETRYTIDQPTVITWS